MLIKILSASWDFHGGPVAKTPRSQCRGLGLILRELDPTCCN